MALLLLVGVALALAFFSGSEAGEVGVCYGMKGSNLLEPPAVVQLLKDNGIKVVTLYDADAGALRALANTGIKVGVSIPNENLTAVAGCLSSALQWVQGNVQAYPDTLIDSVAVGNEVFHRAPELTPQLLPAMRNIQAALAGVGLADAVKVITPIALTALKEPSFPPSLGEFRDDLAQTVMSPIIHFLEQTGSYLSFNVYPYFAYKCHPDEMDLDFVLFRHNKGQLDPSTGLTYYSMFDAMVDAVFHAVEKLSNSSCEHAGGRRMQRGRALYKFTVTENGFPNGKGQIGGALGSDLAGCNSSQKSVEAATTANAQTYVSNLISKILGGGGTPYKPNADISANIFSLFNEDEKTGDFDERNFGIFYPNGTAVYKVDFAGPSWCTANATVGDERLQDALSYACGNGVDCSAIQPGEPCYLPDTVVAHASYAFDAYYQSKGRADGSCDFDGAASIVYQKPTGTCDGDCRTSTRATALTSPSSTTKNPSLETGCSHRLELPKDEAAAQLAQE